MRAGVTTLRDLGDRDGLVLRVRDAINRGDLLGPRLLGSGPPLTPPQGHCWFLGGTVSSQDDIRARNAELGADVIEVMASGGEMRSHRQLGPRSLLPTTWPWWWREHTPQDCPLRRTRTAPTRSRLPPRQAWTHSNTVRGKG